jgi:translocation and assembly module TamB
VAYGGPETTLHLQTTVEKMHITYPETLTTEADARLTLTGSASSSVLSGTATIRDLALHPKSDLTSVLAIAATPPSASAPSSGILAGIRFDVRIETAPGLQLRTSLGQNLQADANLTLRGTVDHPGMLGRTEISEGEALILGGRYTINQGTISFFDPQKIDPILDVDLQTTVQGVTVSINVSGHLDRLKLSYSSDPPMQFNDLVSLLAVGKAPTTDPVLAARQPPQSQQSVGQMGGSFLLGQAIANPVAGRLQRLFGVTQLQVDPQFTGSSATPQATLTVRQQVTRDIALTYSQDLTQSNTQTVRVEWAINRIWSAALERDLNGAVYINLLYKRRLW